jgi:putative aldouronate transport system permease protein
MISYKRSIADHIFDTALHIFMILVFIVMVYPFLYVINYSISTVSQIKSPLLIIPEGIQFKSYAILFRDQSIYRALAVSIARSIIGPIVMIIVTGSAGYVISRPQLIFGKFFRMFFLFTMYMSAGIIPGYLLVKTLGLTNSFIVYILPSAVNAFFMMLIKTYIEALPPSLEEAVLIDGGTEFDAYFKVILRLCLPVNAAVILFACIGQWNSYIDTQLYNAMSPKLYTLQYVLYNTLAVQMARSLEEAQKLNRNVVSSQSLKMAITVITIVPIMCVYPFLQRYFVSGLLVGSIKA